MGETSGLNLCGLGFCGGARLLLSQAPDKGTHFARFHAKSFEEVRQDAAAWAALYCYLGHPSVLRN